MHVERLYAERFRNLTGDGDGGLEWRPHPRFDLVVGDNGQGKTNLLEALSIVAGLRSFRTARLQDSVRFGAQEAVIAVQIQRQGLRLDLGVQIGAKGRKLFVDGRPVTGAAEFLGKLVAVLFTPGDLLLPHAEPAERRRWLDRVVFNHHPVHLLDLRQYERVLGSRNAILKQARQAAHHRSAADPGQRDVDADMLDVYDQLLARHGAVIAQRRLEVVGRFAPLVREVFGRIAQKGLDADVTYAPHGLAQAGGVELEARLYEALRSRRARDLQLGYTTRGPHRDDVVLAIAGRPAHLHASQGQSRALVLALKIAEIRSLERALGEPPLLLMDDVSSELDRERNQALMTYLDELGGQVVLTTTDAAYIQVAAPRQIFRMEAGRLSVGPVLGRPAADLETA